jgi:hypothetical protein
VLLEVLHASDFLADVLRTSPRAEQVAVETPGVDLDVTCEHLLDVDRQRPSAENDVAGRGIEPLPWTERLQALLTRVWSRVEAYPISEEDVASEVELAHAVIRGGEDG